MSLSGGRVLVTGAAGFVGSTLSEALVKEGAEVLGIDCFTDYYPRANKEANLSALKKEKRFTLIEERLERMDLDSVMDGIDVVFHQAAQAGVRASWGKDFEIYTQCNILATQRLLEACKGRAIKRFVYASSSSIYGDAETAPTPETAAPKPVSPYGVAKLAGEHLAVLYAKNFGVPTTALRYFTVYGPRQRPDMAFHRLFQAGLTGEPFTLFGDGEQSRDFTFIEDAVKANIQAALKARPGGVYNIGGGSKATMNQVIRTIEEILGTSLPIERGEKQHGDVRHTSADCTRAREEIGYNPSVNLTEGLTRMAVWAKTAMAE